MGPEYFHIYIYIISVAEIKLVYCVRELKRWLNGTTFWYEAALQQYKCTTLLLCTSETILHKCL